MFCFLNTSFSIIFLLSYNFKNNLERDQPHANATNNTKEGEQHNGKATPEVQLIILAKTTLRVVTNNRKFILVTPLDFLNFDFFGLFFPFFPVVHWFYLGH